MTKRIEHLQPGNTINKGEKRWTDLDLLMMKKTEKRKS